MICDPKYTEVQYGSMLMNLLPKGSAWPRLQNTELYKFVTSFAPELRRMDELASVLCKNAMISGKKYSGGSTTSGSNRITGLTFSGSDIIANFFVKISSGFQYSDQFYKVTAADSGAGWIDIDADAISSQSGVVVTTQIGEYPSEMIGEWETDLGIPDGCIITGATDPIRRVWIYNKLVNIARLALEYGASKRFFYHLGDLLGVDQVRDTAQAGGSNTITLAAGASASNDYYNNMLIEIQSGTGAGQDNIIFAYDGATKIATCEKNWTTPPDNTSKYKIILLQIDETADAVGYCGLAECGLAECGGLESLYHFNVTFKTGNGRPVADCLIDRFKPAHTTVTFSP